MAFNVQDDTRSGVTSTHVPLSNQWGGPWNTPTVKPLGSPTRPQSAPVDPVYLAAQVEVLLTRRGSAPGAGYSRPKAVAAVRRLLAAMDIPAADLVAGVR